MHQLTLSPKKHRIAGVCMAASIFIAEQANAHLQKFMLPRDYGQIIMRLLPQNESRFTCIVGQTVYPTVELINQTQAFLFSGTGPAPEQITAYTNVSYLIYQDQDEKDSIREGQRFSVSPQFELAPSQTSHVLLAVKCPDRSGTYRVEIDLVQEGVSWRHKLPTFKPDMHSHLTLEVIDDNPSQLIKYSQNNPITLPSWFSQLSTEQKQVMSSAFFLAGAQLQLHAVTYQPHGQEFRLFNAGSQYPMVWTRDMASIVRGARSIEGAQKIADESHHWSELFLTLYDQDQGIPDWFATTVPLPPGQQRDKNSVLSDQELWTIVAGLDAISHKEVQKSWLQSEIAYEKNGEIVMISQAMLDSLDWLVQNRWNNEKGCFETGHVADWGDVGLKGKDSLDSTKMHGPRVCGLYMQALAYRALNLLLTFTPEIGYFEHPRFHSSVVLEFYKSKIRDFVATELWQSASGFYKIHVHTDPLTHDFDESTIFALGSHVLALESGLIPPKNRVAVIKNLATCHQKLGLNDRSFGAVLVPSYPKGFFSNPIMDEPYEYQNGGIWDWYAPRAAALIYESNPKRGIELFLTIAKRVLASGSFYEWYQLNGKPGAGRHYHAAAASFIFATQRVDNLTQQGQASHGSDCLFCKSWLSRDFDNNLSLIQTKL